MKITSFQAINSTDILEEYSVRAVAKDRRLYLTLARVMRELQQVASAHEQAMNMLLRSYGKKDDKGQMAVPDDKLSEHGKRIYEYLHEEHEVAIPGKIRLEAFESAGIQPTAMELAVLSWLVISDETELLFSSDDGSQ